MEMNMMIEFILQKILEGLTGKPKISGIHMDEISDKAVKEDK